MPLLFMLQVYDRVLNSRSIPTLVMLVIVMRPVRSACSAPRAHAGLMPS